MPSISPNNAQRTAIEHPPSPLMILAGAGTGKTFTLEHRIAYLINHFKAKPENILTITYTEKAARELKERIIKIVGESAQGITIGTFHSFCYRLLRDFSAEQLPTLMEESEAIHLLLNRYDDLSPFQSDEFPLNPQRAVLESFIPFFNRTRDELIDFNQMKTLEIDGNISSELMAQISDLKRIFPLFQNWKRELNVVDYGDMILLAFNLLHNNTTILKNVQKKYQHVIVDEFQDNNFALNEIIGLIAKNHRQITVVGDEDQTIYSFRGANSYNITEFKNRFGGEPIALEENFRSTQAILDLANASIKHNSERTDTRLFAHKNLDGPKPIIFWGEKNEQLEFLSNKIKSHVNNGLDNKDIAVLCRTHSQAKTAAEALLKNGIPVQATIPSYFTIPVILDLMSWCQVIGKGKMQDNALYRLIEKYTDTKTANRFFNQWHPRDKTPRLELLNADGINFNTFPQIKKLLSEIKYFQKSIQYKSAGEMVWEICEKTRLFTPYNNRYTLDDQLALLTGGGFLKRAQDFSKRNPENLNLSSFNDYMEAVMSSGGLRTVIPENYNALNGVKVSTIHSVKGGEFPVIFLPFLRSVSFPLNFKNNIMISKPPDKWLTYEKATNKTPKEHHLEEERRLFYVAVTRAKSELYILAPRKATSIFVKELPEHLMEETVMPEIINKKSYSELRIKYEQKIQKALADNQFENVHNYTNALKLIHHAINNDKIELGSSPWEMELAQELKQGFEPEINEKLYLSASAIETYQQCPLKYRFGRIDRIPQAASKPQLLFGNIIHSVLQKFHKPNEELSKTRILQLLDEEWRKGEFDYRVREEKFFEQGKEMLSNYVESVKIAPPNVIAREEKFSFDVDDVIITGAIDRIDTDELGVHIIDYKTSKSPTSAKANLQLAIYSMFIEQSDSKEFGKLPASASLYFLREKEKPVRRHTFTSHELVNSKGIITETAHGIRRKEFHHKKSKYCDWCDYKHLICPAWEEK